jgi:hypothetical protein
LQDFFLGVREELSQMVCNELARRTLTKEVAKLRRASWVADVRGWAESTKRGERRQRQCRGIESAFGIAHAEIAEDADRASSLCISVSWVKWQITCCAGKTSKDKTVFSKGMVRSEADGKEFSFGERLS